MKMKPRILKCAALGDLSAGRNPPKQKIKTKCHEKKN